MWAYLLKAVFLSFGKSFVLGYLKPYQTNHVLNINQDFMRLFENCFLSSSSKSTVRNKPQSENVWTIYLKRRKLNLLMLD